MGDFIVTMDDKFMINFCELNDLSSLIDKPTCYKNFDMGLQKLKPQVKLTANIKVLIMIDFRRT